jgi:S1-C subfamily serine protease
MKNFTAILFLMLMILFGAVSFSALNPKTPVTQVEVIEQSMQSVVMVFSEQYPDTPATGFYIGDGVIVTAGHVSKNDSIVKVVFEDGTECEVLERITHSDYDCGFLLIGPVNKPEFEFDFVPVKRGEEIIILGHPEGATFISTKGIVTGYDDYEGFFGDVLLIMVDAVSHAGNSGSPVIDLDGEVRGVHVGGRMSYCGSGLHGYGANISVADILKAMEEAGL